MARGFLVGSLALVVLYVALQPDAARAAAAGGNVVTSALRRAFSPDVAGLPARKTPAAAGSDSSKKGQL